MFPQMGRSAGGIGSLSRGTMPNGGDSGFGQKPQGGTMFSGMARPQQQQPAPPPMMSGGLGPSMQAMGGMMQMPKPMSPPMKQQGDSINGYGPSWGGTKPPQTPPMGQPMPGTSTGMKPPMAQPPPFMKQGMGLDQPQGGIGPSMDAMSSMMQQQPQQVPPASGEAPDFMRQPSPDRMKMY